MLLGVMSPVSPGRVSLIAEAAGRFRSIRKYATAAVTKPRINIGSLPCLAVIPPTNPNKIPPRKKEVLLYAAKKQLFKIKLTNYLSKTKEHAPSHRQGLPVLPKVHGKSDTGCVQAVPDHLVQARVEHGQGEQAHVLTGQQPHRVPEAVSH